MSTQKIEHPYYPIVYVRGYAARMSEIEDTVATPYMGFNLGSTKIRQNYDDHVVRFIFESPLIRLMKDEGYIDAYDGGDYPHRAYDADPTPQTNDPVQPRSIWIYRYYDEVSEDLGSGNRKTIEYFAAGLRHFIFRIRDRVCGDDEAERKKFKVYLVAHSMGGLICRCYLQNLCKHGGDPNIDLPGDPLVDKVFTYATPHNGIEIAGVNVPDVGSLDPVDVRNFNRDYMRDYLKIGNVDTPVSSLEGKFPTERFFSFVGTNHRDYDAFFGMSKRGTGPMSDGLVMMKNAAVERAPRAFAHRSHSGHFGIVNSEEGYQNLRRFLFGQIRVDAWLDVDEITLPEPVQKKKDEGHEIRARYNIETGVKVRGGDYYLSERRVSQQSAIRRSFESLVEQNKPVRLFTGYLLRAAKAKNADTALAFAIEMGIEVPVFEVDKRYWFDEYFEGERLINDTITLHVRQQGGNYTVRYGLASDVGPGVARRMVPLSEPSAEGWVELTIPIGFKENARNKPRPGFRGHLRLRACPWNLPPSGDD